METKPSDEKVSKRIRSVHGGEGRPCTRARLADAVGRCETGGALLPLLETRRTQPRRGRREKGATQGEPSMDSKQKADDVIIDANGETKKRATDPTVGMKHAAETYP